MIDKVKQPWVALKNSRARTAIVVVLLILVLFPTWVRDRFEEIWENRPWGNEGAIALETPQLFTRGRLVNDRALESNWLEGQLMRTDELMRENRFASPDFIKFARQRLAITLNGDANSKSPAIAEDRELAKRFADLGLRTQPLDQFEDAARYRSAIRNALMSTALDDRHDIEGNTIYRFNFNVAIVPPRGTNRIAAATVVLQQAAKINELPSLYVEVLHDWRGKLQLQVERLVEDRIHSIEHGRGFDAEQNQSFQVWAEKEMATLWKELGEPPPDFLSNFYRFYQNASLRQQLLQIEWVYKRVRALSKVLPPSANDRFDFLYAVLDQCRRNGTFWFPDERRAEIHPDDFQFLQCPSQPSPLKGTIELLDALTIAVEARRTIDSSCVGRSQVLGFLYNAATPPLPAVEPTVKHPVAMVPEASSTCRDEGRRLYKQRAAGGFSKRQTDIAAKFVSSTLTFERPPKSDLPIRLGDFFRIGVPKGCRDGSCIPVVELNTDTASITQAKLAGDLLKAVEGRARVFTYAVVPNKTVQRTETAQRTTREASGLASLFGSPVGASGGADVELMGTEKDPTVIGFGDFGAQKDAGTTLFGWAMFPRAINGNGTRRHSAENYSVSALVSLPGWWKTAHLQVFTCWMSESDLKNGVDCRKHNSKAPQEFAVRLPGDAGELMQNLRFEVISYPYLDRSQDALAPLEVGRPAGIVIRGGRLWRSPIVRLGAQQADRIEVLPDMQGIIARFDCVLPDPGTRGDGEQTTDKYQSKAEKKSRPQRTDSFVAFRVLHVFTSEGGANPTNVPVRPFLPRAGYLEEATKLNKDQNKTRTEDEPCWIRMERDAKEEKERKNFLVDEEMRRYLRLKEAALKAAPVPGK